MKFLVVMSVVLAVASLIDGISTARFLSSKTYTYKEQNPIFGRNPSPRTVYLRGTAVILLEVGLAFLLSHLWHPLYYILASGAGLQSGMHLFFARRNFKLPV